ncbi:butyrophilin-like protein 3 [Petaurus breviceps papuanus]|uniref:butyrophilin-like protein 3 n=1 Tax=Petaurus breviceps papuanus TaxID=3040969 RepID=UPI0036DEBA24
MCWEQEERGTSAAPRTRLRRGTWILFGSRSQSSVVLENRSTDMLSISVLPCHIQASRSFECHLFLIFALNLIGPGSGHFQVIGPHEPIQALVGKDVNFSCHVLPKMSLEDMEVRFFRDRFSSVLLLYKEGKEMQKRQMQEYQGRTQCVQDAVTEGRISLKLKNVTLSDSGIYGCWFSSQTFYQEHTWELHVAALGSSPFISLERYIERGILLICRSFGWFPRPEVQWKNHQGLSLSSGFKINTGDNGLFNIETSLTLQEAPTGGISCSIDIWGHKQESRMRIADQFFQPSPWSYAFGVMMVILLILIASVFFLHRNKGQLTEELDRRIKMEKRVSVSLRVSLSVCLSLSPFLFLCLSLHLFLPFFFHLSIYPSSSLFLFFSLSSFHNASSPHTLHTIFFLFPVKVTLDPETAHPKLRVSEDCKTVTYKDSPDIDLSDTEKRFQSRSVVASQGFSLGEFYWEVEVGKKNRWYLGVCSDDVERKTKDPELSPAYGYWVLGRWNQKEYFTFSPNRQSLTLQVQPTQIGIFLNCKYKQVSFYNVTDKSHIYTFTGCDFNGKIIHPYFRPRSNDIDEKSLPLVICTKLHEL